MKIIIKLKNNLHRFKQWFIGESLLIIHWFKNIYFTFLSPNSRLRIFEGHGHYWFAKKYADRRTKISRLNKYCGGKRHYVLPAGDYSLIVINRNEIKKLQSKGYYKGLDILKIFENAYYVTK